MLKLLIAFSIIVSGWQELITVHSPVENLGEPP